MKLCFRNFEHEVFWEATDIALYRLIQNFHIYVVQLCEIGIEHHLLSTNHIDTVCDVFCGSESGCHEEIVQ
jgi:hypothetical protein